MSRLCQPQGDVGFCSSSSHQRPLPHLCIAGAACLAAGSTDSISGLSVTVPDEGLTKVISQNLIKLGSVYLQMRNWLRRPSDPSDSINQPPTWTSWRSGSQIFRSLSKKGSGAMVEIGWRMSQYHHLAHARTGKPLLTTRLLTSATAQINTAAGTNGRSAKPMEISVDVTFQRLDHPAGNQIAPPAP